MDNLATVDIKGKPYVEVKTRVQWFRKNIENGCIETEILHFDKESTMMKATAYIDGKVVATGTAHEEKSKNTICKVRLTLDYEEDYWLLQTVRRILGSLTSRQEVDELFIRNPDLYQINWFRNEEWKQKQIEKSEEGQF